MPSSASISGLISGLKTEDIVAKMLEFAQRPITVLQSRQTGYTNRLTAWQAVNTKLLGFKVKAAELAAPANFQGKAATVSTDDSAYIGIQAVADASAGSYSLKVNRLATGEVRQSQSFADIDKTTVGTGTITVGVGGSTKQITVTSANNTLSGLRDAINRAGVGATASIVDLGSNSTHDYRLVLSSGGTGASAGVTWISALSGGSAPTWTVTTAANDALITVGSGANAVEITKGSNTISDVFPGVVLTLKKEDAGREITFTISDDTAGIKSKIRDFVGMYNDLMTFIGNQTAYDAETKTGGVLVGDFGIQQVQQQITSTILDAIPGLAANRSSLASIGFALSTTGQLSVSDADLDAALKTDPTSLMKLFANYGETTDYSIAFESAASTTKATGVSGGYTVRVDQTALQARVTAGAAQSDVLAADEVMTVNGVEITLTAGMTGEQVVERINSRSISTGVLATRTGADGAGTGSYLTLATTAYGSVAKITAESNRTNGGALPSTDTSGFGTTRVTEASAAGETGTGTGTEGRDVVGAFGVTVNGATTWEAATGSGRRLTGNAGNSNTDGLKVNVSSTTTGEHGQVSFTRGVTAQLDSVLGYLTGDGGMVTVSENSLNELIADSKSDIAAKSDRLNDYEARIRDQFLRLESAMSKLTSQSDYLTQQIEAMNTKS